MRKIVLPILGIMLFGFGCTKTQPLSMPTGGLDPTAVCEIQGGTVEYSKQEADAPVMCVFDDGSECEVWALYKDTCQKGTYYPSQQAGIANPASQYCEYQGGTVEMREEEGGIVGYCIFADGKECEEWSLYRGECGLQEQQLPSTGTVDNKANMQLTSTAFQHGGVIPSKYSCDGANINPLLSISEVPENTKSLALIVDDPDAPGGTWVHWVVWNIDPSIKEIAEDSVPAGAVQGINSSDTVQYEGPCPPGGTHRYYFKLYALDTLLPDNMNESINAAELRSSMQGHILQQTELMGKYGI